jgi:DNA (cytosine-5)-methyltransferase 1
MVTIREAARLQSFPDSFEFKGNMGDRFRQIGNAVPPLLAKAIAEEVVKVISGGDAGE